MKNRAFLFCVALALLCAAPAVKAQTSNSAPPQNAAAGNKIGVVRMQYAIANTLQGKQASVEIEAQFKPRQAELDGISKDIDAISKQLQTAGNMLSDDEKAKKARQGQALQHKYQALGQELQDELNAAEQEAAIAIGNRMVDVVDRYSRENGYTAILDSSNQQGLLVVYFAKQVDVTDDVIKLYDQQFPLKSGTAAPAPKQPGQPATQTPPAKKPGGGPGGPGGNH